MTNPTNNFGWQMPTPTDLVTDLPADFEVFGQAVDTSMADLKGGTTGQILSKATNTDMDFTWITNDVGDITAVNVTAPITGGGTSGAVTIGVSAASTAAAGVVQLSDSTSTTSSVLASTPTATKSAYDLANTANTAAGAAQTTANSATTTANAAVPKSTVTTAGDIIYATGSGAVTRLGIGSTGQILKVAAGLPSWGAAGAPAFVGVLAGGSQATVVTNGSTNYALAMNSESFDTNGFHDNATNNTRITIPTGYGGKYQINASAGIESGSSIPGSFQMWIRVNGTGGFDSVSASQMNMRNNANGAVNNNGNKYGIAGILNLNAGDYFEVLFNSTNGSGNMNVTVVTSASYLGA